ncbi:MAG: hypothetical protein IJS50_00870, partial [Desulfovibrio sp.]|nr:hypothetical protein [Desulfovibrio sp.]
MARQGFLAQVAELMSLTLASRCLGLVRDLALAWVIGVGPLADCLAQTLRLPHAFRRLLGEGIFSLNLTTAFIEHRAKIAQSIDQVKRQDYCVQGLYLALKGQLRRLLGPFFVGLFLLWAFLASVGFGSPGLLSQEFWLWALTLPYLFCLSLTALPMAYLHAQGVFRPSALAP